MFCLKTKENKIANNIIDIYNGKNKDINIIKSGYEKVALTRLNDRIFFLIMIKN